MGLQRNDGQNRGWVLSSKDARMIFMWSQMLVVEETSQVHLQNITIKHNADLKTETRPSTERCPLGLSQPPSPPSNQVKPDHRKALKLTDFMEALVAVVSGHRRR